jgi:hypothetical protein
MSLSFLPNKATMCKEIEQWIAIRKLDTLLSVCECCVFKAYDFILTQECRTCMVRKGILRITDERNQELRQEAELLQA